MKEDTSEPLSVILFDEMAFLALRVPEVCRAGVMANLALLNDHVTCLNKALAGGESEET